ncbi:MAG TPA: sigma-70 family RNA polymerase sigma factor [Dehalococcoidia bacterium]|nr:sigma-70 family RNA polymerase sigma factor [Dehalococcoidia bacterium]
MVEYQELDDRQLIRQTALGVREALEELYNRYSTPVFSLARFMLRHEALAEEATQDIFLNIWLKSDSYRADRGDPKAWIMSVAHHKVIDIIRSRRRNINLTDPKDYETLDLLPSRGRATDEEAVLNLERERINKALAVLPEAQREVIMLAYFEGYSQSEISNKLNQPLGTVKTRVRLAMQKLRVELEENGTEPI